MDWISSGIDREGSTRCYSPAREGASLAKPRILIVDDDAGTLESLSRAFALEGLTTLAAS